MQPEDIQPIADVIAETVKASTEPLIVRLVALETREVVHGKDGTNGKDGADGIAGKDGHDGTNGLDGAAGVDAKDGVNGRDGVDGKDGHDGANGTDGAAGRDGQDGLNGKDGAEGIAGQDGAAGVDGKDGHDAVLPADLDARIVALEQRAGDVTPAELLAGLTDVFRAEWAPIVTPTKVVKHVLRDRDNRIIGVEEVHA